VKTPLCLAVLTLFFAGCGAGSTPKPKPISGPAKDVAAVVERLQKATAQKDFQTICNDLLSAATRRESGGTNCPAVLGARARGVSRPRIVIKSIEVDGPSARVAVRTTAGGQAETTDIIQLVREHGHFRIASLGR
jgi:hypothetical protein